MPLYAFAFRLCRRSGRGAFLLLAVVLLVGSHSPAAPSPAESPEKHKERLAAAPVMVVHCMDGSVLNLRVLDSDLTLKTPYGKLVIPFARIKEVECATRLPENTARQIATALGDLGSDQGKTREAAAAVLLKLGARAYPALLKQENASNVELRRQVKRLLEKIREDIPEEELVVRDRDVVVTDDSRIAGQLGGDAVTVHTPVFGETRLKLTAIRTLRSKSAEPVEKEEAGNVLPAPASLQHYQGQIGKVFRFRVTGALGGNIWGSDVYTLDSSFAQSAVHAGVVKVGKTAVVKVKILPPQAGFAGTTRNGVTSMAFQAYPGAYQFVKK